MFLNVLVWTAFTFCMVSAAPEQEMTYAQRLGWPPGTKVVIFHVDDAGMSYDSDRGAIQALEEGVATSTSVMMPCPWVPHIAAYLKDHPQTDAGLHLTLTSEWDNYRWGPLVGRAAAPGLVDPQGYFWPRVEDVLNHATVEEFEMEIRAQIDKAQTVGIHARPTSTATWGRVSTSPSSSPMSRSGIEKKIPVLMIGGHMQYAGPELGKFKLLLHAMGERVWKAGLPVIDDLVTQPTNGPGVRATKAAVAQAARRHEAGHHGDHRSLHRPDGGVRPHLQLGQGPRSGAASDARPRGPRVPQEGRHRPDHLAGAQATPGLRRAVGRKFEVGSGKWDF